MESMLNLKLLLMNSHGVKEISEFSNLNYNFLIEQG